MRSPRREFALNPASAMYYMRHEFTLKHAFAMYTKRREIALNHAIFPVPVDVTK